MKKSKSSRSAVHYQEGLNSPVMRIGLVFFMVVAIGLLVYAVKVYTPAITP